MSAERKIFIVDDDADMRDSMSALLEAAGYPPGYYAAFVLDTDGNNMEAVFREG
jgi:FixJ family two-component response regulator